MTASTVRAAIYTRVSSAEQVDGTSLDTQAERCRAYAASHGWKVVDAYSDEGISGALPLDQRPALTRLMAAAAAGRVDVILVAKLDRLGRSMRHLSPLLADLDDQGVSLVSIAEAFDSGSTAGRLMRNLLGSMAEWERDVIRERTRAGVNARVRAGGWGGGHLAPFGYRVVGSGRDAHLEPDAREAEVVRQMVAMVLDHRLSTLETAKRLNALGLHPRSAPLWTGQNVRNCLTRGQWSGTWTFGRTGSERWTPEAITVTVEPILAADRAAALAAHLAATTLTRGSGEVHPLTGRLFCECGEPMTGIARSDKARRRRYRCRQGRQQPGRRLCPNASVRGQEVDDAVWGQVLALLTDPDHLMALAQERLGMLQGAAEVEADALEQADAAVARTQAALASTAARCLTLGLDDATTAATLAHVQEAHRAAVQHRAMVAAMTTQTVEAQQRMVTAQALAQVARERLVDADSALRSQVFGLLDVRVTITGREPVLTVQVDGSVAHDLLLTSVDAPVAPALLATGDG